MTTNEPSQNIEVEGHIIGALIKDIDHSKCRETLDSLDANDFYSRSHRGIFKTIKLMAEAKKEISLSLIEEIITFARELNLIK